MKSFKFKQKGFTLVEVAIVVAIGALLLIGLTQAPRIIASNKANADISELPLIVTNIQKIYANQATYAGANLTTVIGLNGMPPERVVTPTTSANRWGGPITMAAATQLTANDSIDLSYANVPDLECTNIVPAVESRFSVITVNGTVVKPFNGVLNQANLVTGCNAAPTAIVYRFTK